MSSHDERHALTTPTFAETARLIDEKVAATTAPLLARIEELERQVAELQAVVTVLANAYGSSPERADW